jgi:hypothetical protein
MARPLPLSMEDSGRETAILDAISLEAASSMKAGRRRLSRAAVNASPAVVTRQIARPACEAPQLIRTPE